MPTIEIATACALCEAEIEISAEYDSGADSVAYVCPECNHEGGIANWEGSNK